jgi:predicted dehydrogenase
MKNSMRVGIIGCGNISGIYAKSGSRFPNIEIAACADIDPGRARAVADEHGIPCAMDTEELLADPSIEVVVNLTVPAAHSEVALRALRKGKHVYNEKPLAVRRRDAREVLGLARDKGLRVGCAPDTFLGAGLQTCRMLIDEGAIGRPLAASAHMMKRGIEAWHPNPEFFYKKGAGPLFDMGPYYLTALVSMLGPVRRVTSSAQIGIPVRTITCQSRAGQTIAVETPTHIAAVLDFEEGPVATLTTSFEVSSHSLPPIEIYGEEGTLAAPDPNTFGGPVRIQKRGEQDWQEVPLAFPYAENSRGLGVSDMIHAELTGNPHRASGTLAFHVLDIMHSILDASETSRHMEITSTTPRPDPLSSSLSNL